MVLRRPYTKYILFAVQTWRLIFLVFFIHSFPLARWLFCSSSSWLWLWTLSYHHRYTYKYKTKNDMHLDIFWTCNLNFHFISYARASHHSIPFFLPRIPQLLQSVCWLSFILSHFIFSFEVLNYIAIDSLCTSQWTMERAREEITTACLYKNNAMCTGSME